MEVLLFPGLSDFAKWLRVREPGHSLVIDGSSVHTAACREVMKIATYLKRIPTAFAFQFFRSEDLPDESLCVVYGVLGIGIRQLQAVVPHAHVVVGEGHHAGYAEAPVSIRYNLHLPRAGQKDADGAVRRAQIDPDDFGRRHRQILLGEVPGQQERQHGRAWGSGGKHNSAG